MPAEAALNPLLSSQKASDSGLQIALHPLVLLTISDYITRHTLRRQTGPIVGALIGQQNGREVTIEHAFECLLEEGEDDIVLNKAWFEDRLQQMKDVHKVPLLDLVGWYTTLSTSGPQPSHLPIHEQILHSYNESAILLGFHETAVADDSAGGKLPLTIYESIYESADPTPDNGEDKEMRDGEPKLALKFKALPYSVETGEAEMISVDFVARGGGNATAVNDGNAKKSDSAELSTRGKTAAKKAEHEESAKLSEQDFLSTEDEEFISSLTAKANAIKMLQARINLISTYLQQLPQSFVSSTVPDGGVSLDNKKQVPINYSILRSIQALLCRLSLLIPADNAAFEHQLMAEQNDVNLISLLSNLTESIKDVKEVGRKYGIVDKGKGMRNKDKGGWDNYGGNGVLGVGDLL